MVVRMARAEMDGNVTIWVAPAAAATLVPLPTPNHQIHMTPHLKLTCLLFTLGTALTLGACQGTNGVPAANTSTSASTATHDTTNPPPPATSSSERSGAR
jgi:hypothetical protein